MQHSTAQHSIEIYSTAQYWNIKHIAVSTVPYLHPYAGDPRPYCSPPHAFSFELQDLSGQFPYGQKFTVLPLRLYYICFKRSTMKNQILLWIKSKICCTLSYYILFKIFKIFKLTIVFYLNILQKQQSNRRKNKVKLWCCSVLLLSYFIIFVF